MEPTGLSTLREKLNDPDASAAFVVQFAAKTVADLAVHLYATFGLQELQRTRLAGGFRATHETAVAKTKARLEGYRSVFGDDAFDDLWGQIMVELDKTIADSDL